MSCVTLILSVSALAATDPCGNDPSREGERGYTCVVRELTPAATRSLTVDARDNGGIAVTGQDGAGIRVVAKVSARAPTKARSAAIVEAVEIGITGSRIAATGPSRENSESWAVSYEITAPRGTDLVLQSHNGGLSVTGIDANVALSTTNGGISLEDVNGKVGGTTANGGVDVILSGPGWRGAGLDVQTTNGGVSLALPRTYGAELEVGTVHGGVAFAGLGEHSEGNRIRTTLGGGGAPIRVVTTNGGVSVSAR